MKRIAILGGGITGLSAAYHLEKARKGGAEVEYTLFEAGPRLGGVIHTERVADCVLETGPDSFLSAKPWARALAEEAGLGGELIFSNDHQRKTYILDRGRLIAMPDGLMMMVPTAAWPVALSPLFSFKTKVRMGLELLRGPAAPAPVGDESVADFVRRHFGDEAVAKLAEPLLAGVYGGDASHLSARSVLSMFVEMEKKSKSLVRGMLAARRKRGAHPQPLFTSLKGGLGQLIDALAKALPAPSVRMNTTVERLAREGEGWTASIEGAQEGPFTHVVCALPADGAASTLREIDGGLAESLAGIPYAGAITLSLIYDGGGIRLPAGFGFLVPKGEGRQMIACTFVHNKFSFRAPEEKVIIRVVLSSGMERPDDELVRVVRGELREILGLEAEPISSLVQRWPRALPQYAVGHQERVAKLEAMAKEHPGLLLCGSYLRGVGIPDCVREGRAAADKVLA